MIIQESSRRSICKALTYRALILCLDFLVIYLLTGQPKLAAGFMILSNLYTTLGYFFHERVWSRIRWGLEPQLDSLGIGHPA